MDFNFSDPLWIISQIFAFLALIFSIWSFQVKSKIKLLFLIGTFSVFLAISASFLENYTLGVLFGLAGIRNFVFCYIDWRISKGVKVPRWISYMFAAIFAIATITSTVVLVYIFQVDTAGIWLEWMICLTLLGLILGNILEGTNLMRCSFIANRVFNLVNHIYFDNAIAVIIAVAAIASNIIYYIRMLFAWLKERKKEPSDEGEDALGDEGGSADETG